MRLKLLTQLMTALALALQCSALAVGTRAGTAIMNVAEVHLMQEGPDDPPVAARTNTTHTVVNPVCAVHVTPDGTETNPGQQLTIDPREHAVFRYTVRNTGNDRHTLTLGWKLLAASTYTPAASQVRMMLDANGNGVIDAAETDVTSVTLDADASAGVLLAVRTDAHDIGTAYLDLTATCAQGATDDGNVAALRVRGVTQLAIGKSFGQGTLTPGDAISVTLTVTNTANTTATGATVTDTLNTPDLHGLLFEAGTVQGGSVEYSSDGQTWTAEPTTVNALRWRVPDLAPGAARTVTFSLRAAPHALPGPRVNRATLDHAGRTTTGAASTNVGAAPAVAIGPHGNAPAAPGGEGSADDRQQLAEALVDQTVCFRHTLLNTGNVPDEYRVTPTVTSGDADVTLLTADGQALAQPLHVNPGQTLELLACLTPRTPEALTVVLEVTSAAGAAPNRTTNVIATVGRVRPATDIPLLKTVLPEGTVAPGGTLTYTLNVSNPYTITLTNVVVSDTLDPRLELVSADGGSHAAGVIRWTAASLAPGETVRFTLRARVRQDVPDGQGVPNTFTLTSDQVQTPLVSNTVRSPVWNSALAIEKTADAQRATVGDQLGFTLRVTNTSGAGTLRVVDITDRMPAGLTYLPGTTRVNGQPAPDPAAGLTWQVGPLGPGETATVHFLTRVTPDAPREIVNVARATALAFSGAALASGQVSAAVRTEPGTFGVTDDVVGRVFVDRDGDHAYHPALDTPVGRARVILADGRSALTDTEGRYHFQGVNGPTLALRLDPSSVPYTATPVPQDGGLRGTRLVSVGGLTSVDFPLDPQRAAATVTRETTVRAGPLNVSKTLRAVGSTYEVRLVLRADRPLPGWDLDDPLPAGATLTDGATRIPLSALPAGESTLTYRFRFEGGPAAALTDPRITRSAP